MSNVIIEVEYEGSREDAKRDSEMFGFNLTLWGFLRDKDWNGSEDGMALVKGPKSKVVDWLVNVHHQGETLEDFIEEHPHWYEDLE